MSGATTCVRASADTSRRGIRERRVTVADAAELHAAAPEPRTIRWYEAGHSLGPQGQIDRHAWLNAEIGLDPFHPPS
jgi:hypothetical protein